MSLKPITTIESTGIPLGLDHVDTDQIIPAQFLKVTSKAGLGKAAFHGLRFSEEGSPIAEFPLNDARYEGGTVLLAGRNFGCGSSREHAPWALVDYGVQAVIASSFADIFRNNALKNGLLPIALDEVTVADWTEAIRVNPALKLFIDLTAQTVSLEGKAMQSFHIDDFWRHCLLNGVDQVGYTLSHEAAISAFEARLVTA